MRARLVMVAMLLVAGCKGGQDKDGPGPKSPGPAAAPGHPGVPKVELASALAADDSKPPLLVVIDDPRPPGANEKIVEMAVHVAVARSWGELAKQDPTKGAKPATVDQAYKIAREAQLLGQPPEDAWKHVDEQLADLAPASRDDPPPPEEEDRPDDGADESGGTGTAMALDEGKMGKKDAERAEGQYKMQKNPVAQGLGGERGPLMRMPPSRFAHDDGEPTRLADVAGEVKLDGKLSPHPIAILATPRTNAQRLALAIAALTGALVVEHAGVVRPLRLDFTPGRDSALVSSWIEVRAAKQGFAVEPVPDTPIEVSDAKQLAAAIDKARVARNLPPNTPVDLLVEPDADAQRLVDLLVALDAAGVRLIGIGAAPAAGSDEAKRRGHRNPTIAIGQPAAQGDLDKSEIRKVVKAASPKVLACYTAALAKQPALAGTVQTQFLITPKGKVARADASGVDAAVAKCVAGVIKTLQFPKPKGGGSVQVNYPFIMRP